MPPLFLSPILAFASIAATQPASHNPIDTAHPKKPPHYFSCTILTGGAVQFYPKKSGFFAVSFPYSVVDVSGAATADTFTARQRNAFGSANVLVGPLAFEAGRKHDFVHLQVSFLLGKGISAPGYKVFWGYGRIVYTGRYAIKFSLNLSVTSDPRQGGDQLGSIDNSNKTVGILGFVSLPTFIAAHDETINVSTLAITYAEREWSLMPAVSLLPNPYRKPNHFELTVGYTLPVSNEGNLNFVQQGSSISSGTTSNLIPGPSILSSGITASYNNKPLKAPLYRFGGFYLELRFDVIDMSKKKKT